MGKKQVLLFDVLWIQKVKPEKLTAISLQKNPASVTKLFWYVSYITFGEQDLAVPQADSHSARVLKLLLFPPQPPKLKILQDLVLALK